MVSCPFVALNDISFSATIGEERTSLLGGRNDLNFLATVGHDPALWGEGAGMNYLNRDSWRSVACAKGLKTTHRFLTPRGTGAGRQFCIGSVAQSVRASVF